MLNFLPTLAHADESRRSKVEEIYRNYHELMYKVALRKLSCSADAAHKAEDAVQNAFLKIISHFEAIRFDGGEDRLRAYVVSIAIHEASDLLNRKEDFSFDTLEDKIPSDEDFVTMLCMREEYESVKKAILQLNDRYQVVLYQYFVEENDGPEIAELLDMNLSTVYTTLQRGKGQLLKMLKGGAKNERGK